MRKTKEYKIKVGAMAEHMCEHVRMVGGSIIIYDDETISGDGDGTLIQLMTTKFNYCPVCGEKIPQMR